MQTTAFDLSQERKVALYQSGIAAAANFLMRWDFEEYKALYRSGRPAPRFRDLVWSQS